MTICGDSESGRVVASRQAKSHTARSACEVRSASDSLQRAGRQSAALRRLRRSESFLWAVDMRPTDGTAKAERATALSCCSETPAPNLRRLAKARSTLPARGTKPSVGAWSACRAGSLRKGKARSRSTFVASACLPAAEFEPAENVIYRWESMLSTRATAGRLIL